MNFNTLLLLGLGGWVLFGMKEENQEAVSSLAPGSQASCDECRRMAEQRWPRNAYGYPDRGAIQAQPLPSWCAPTLCNYEAIRPDYTPHAHQHGNCAPPMMC